MAATIRIKPRRGVQLAGIPAAGADVPAALGREWIQAKLATEQKPKATTKPASRPTEG